MFPRRSLQSHFIAIILGITIVLTGIMGILNLRSINIYSTWVANTGLNWETEKTAADLNKPLLHSTDAVNFIASTMRQYYTDVGQVRDAGVRHSFDQRLYHRFLAAVETVPEINGFYIHYNENLTEGPDGFWYRKEPGGGGFTEGTITDVRKALAENSGATDWYTMPRAQQHALWLPPLPDQWNRYLGHLLCEAGLCGPPVHRRGGHGYQPDHPDFPGAEGIHL